MSRWMDRLRVGFLSVVLSSLAFACGPGEPERELSRGTAEGLLRAHLTDSMPVPYVLVSVLPGHSCARLDTATTLLEPWGGKAQLAFWKAAEAEGYILRRDVEWGVGRACQATLTPTWRDESTAWHTGFLDVPLAPSLPTVNIPIGSYTLITITGVTQAPESSDARAEFTWVYGYNALGTRLRTLVADTFDLEVRGIPTGIGTAQLRRYDDGWRVVDIETHQTGVRE